MVNQSQTSPKYLTDKLIAVALVVWLLFFGGFTQIKTWLTPNRLSQVAAVADTIKTGVGRVTAGNGAPPAKPAAAPATGRLGDAWGAGLRPTAASQAQIEAAGQAAFQATAQAADIAAAVPAAAAPAVAPDVANPATYPTAVIVIPTAQAIVVPVAYPQTYASNDPPTTTPVPTMTYPTPLPAAVANAYTLSPDGTCITVERGGKQYQTCQDWPYKDHEARTIADLMRTGVIPGTEVQ